MSIQFENEKHIRDICPVCFNMGLYKSDIKITTTTGVKEENLYDYILYGGL